MEPDACPFCGATEVCLSERWLGYHPEYYVDCLVCDGRGPIRDSREEAVEAWNKPPRPTKT